MTKKQIWQYRCEFCGKRGLSSGHMKTHEKHCTANPERVCRMHRYFSEDAVPSVKQVIAAFNSKQDDYGLKEVRKVTSNCPMCILAAIRQSGICKRDGDPEANKQPPTLAFDFKQEMEVRWKEINANAAEEEENRARHYY